MSLEKVAAAARAAGADDAALPLLRLDSDADAGALVAWFGADRERAAVRLVIAGEPAGVLERTALYALVANRTLGWGDGIGATLPGDPSWEPIELRCPVPGCPEGSVWVLSLGAAAHCAVHPGVALEPVS